MVTNLFSIEDELKTRLESLSGLDAVYKAALKIQLKNTTADTPCVFLSFGGFAPGDPDSRVNKQLVKTLWSLVFVCRVEDYEAIGGALLLEIMEIINGYEADDWFGPAKLYSPPQSQNEPDLDGGLMFFPVTFAIDIVTKKCSKKIP